MRKLLLSCLAAAVMAVSAAHAASPLDDPSLPGAGPYERCLVLVKKNAHRAELAARAWHDQGGGPAALHCTALALVAQHRYGEAAHALEQAALASPANKKDMAATLYDQEGNAWLLDGQPQAAQTAFDAALSLSPGDEDLLFDRARARAARKNWPGADADLSALLQTDPNRADALVLRASARHAEGHRVQAEADIARALQVYPGYPEALVERGVLDYEAGDPARAREAWTEVVRDAPDGDAAAAARQHLAELDSAPPKTH
jgi:tetratricopeptide (TPR) repeat protein